MVVQAVPNGFGFGGRVFWGSKPKRLATQERASVSSNLCNCNALKTGKQLLRKKQLLHKEIVAVTQT